MRGLLDLLLPPRCPGCGREGVALCDDCDRTLYRRSAEPPGAPLGLPTPLPRGLLQLEWCAAYSGAARGALHALKYRGERRLVDPIADALAERWASANAGGNLLTWVPVHPSRRRDRGFDQAEDLAVAVARRLRIPVAGSLERVAVTTAQHGLGQQERVGNVAGAFVVSPQSRPAVHGRWVVVVDDIVTTGATLSGCATALRVAGANAVSALTVARDR